MTLSISFNFENADDLLKFLNCLKEHGFDRFLNKPRPKKINNNNRDWKHLGIGNLGGALDTLNSPLQ